jgi:hypothetical protein
MLLIQTTPIKSDFQDYKSISFASASTQYVTFPVGYQAFAANQPWSVSFWFNFTSYGTFSTPLSSEGGAGVNFRGTAIYIASTGTVPNWEIAALGGHVARITCAPAAVSTGVWAHWVLTRDATATTAGMKWYLNGSSQTVTSITNTLLTSDDTVSTANLNFGRDSNGGANCNGAFDDLSFYNVELTSAQVTEIYNSGKPKHLKNTSAGPYLTGWHTFENSTPNDRISGVVGTPVNTPTYSTSVP